MNDTLCKHYTMFFYFKSQQIAKKTFIAIFAPVIGPFLENYVFKSGFSTACHTKRIGT